MSAVLQRPVSLTEFLGWEGDVLQMPEIGVELALSEIYADVELGPGEDAEADSSPT